MIILFKVLYVHETERKRKIADRPVFDTGTNHKTVRHGVESVVYRFESFE